MSKTTYPWEEANPNAKKVFNLRLPEDLYEQLRYIAYHDRESVHAFCVRAVAAAVHKRLRQLGVE